MKLSEKKSKLQKKLYFSAYIEQVGVLSKLSQLTHCYGNDLTSFDLN